MSSNFWELSADTIATFLICGGWQPSSTLVLRHHSGPRIGTDGRPYLLITDSLARESLAHTTKGGGTNTALIQIAERVIMLVCCVVKDATYCRNS
jgi:hypothetical protein